MPKDPKTDHIQIRVSAAAKRSIQEQAKRAGTTLSDWILRRLVPSTQDTFQDLVGELAVADEPGFVFAAILDLLGSLGADEFRSTVSERPRVALEPYWANYLAATVEYAAAKKRADAPGWTLEVPPSEEPVFGSALPGLRLYLLTTSPAAFRRRNIFIDASVGDRV